MLVPRCRDAAGAAWQQFREQWAQLHALSRARRFEALASLQPLAELEVLGSNLTVHAFYFLLRDCYAGYMNDFPRTLRCRLCMVGCAGS